MGLHWETFIHSIELCDRRHVLKNRNVSSSLDGLKFAHFSIQNPHYDTVQNCGCSESDSMFVTCCSPVLTGGTKSFPKNSASFLCYKTLLLARS